MTRARLALLLGLAVTLLLRPAAPGADGARVLEPAVFEEDFQHDSLGQWASYPPAQDNGYDPSLAPTGAFAAPGGRALMRVVTPTARGDLRVGFIRRTPLWTSDDAHVAFAHRIEPDVLRPVLEIGVAGGNGRRYSARLETVAGAWRTASLPLADLRDADGRSLGAGIPIEAFYVVALFADASPAVTHRFLIDDIRLRAAREAAFELRMPQARGLDPWREQPADRWLSVGDPIAIDAAVGYDLASASWMLIGPDGVPLRRGILRAIDAEAGRRWQADAGSIQPGDPPGIWRLVLEGRLADGRALSTTVRLTVLPQAPHGRPRLYFGARDLERLRARRQHPQMVELWERLQAGARASRESGRIDHGGAIFEMLDAEYLLPSLSAYADVVNRARLRIANNALVGVIDDDAVAREAAKDAILQVAAWSRWHPPWFESHGQHTYYPAGLLAQAVALAYDLLFDELTPAERRTIRQALVERQILPTWREYVLDNRIMANTSNWLAHTVGAAILAAAAIAGDGDPDEQAALAGPLGGLLMKIEDHMAASFLADGSYGEGISYLEFDLDTLGPMLQAVERVFGHSYWERTHVLESLRYPLHLLAHPPGATFDQGDTHPPAGHGIAPIVFRSPDPVMRWYYQQFTPRTIYDFIFFDERVTSAPPEGFGSRLFREKGNAVFRTGWRPEDAILLFRAGATFNHNHNDQGAFLFRARGETLVSEAGWSDYYRDPHYGTFFIQPAGHSTLLVDGHPESQQIADTAQFAALDAYPRITDAVLSPFYDVVGSELAPIYRGRLAAYERRLAFVKPNHLVVFDRVHAGGRPARYHWLLHVRDRSGLHVSDGSAADVAAVYAGTNAAMAVRPVVSEPTRLAVHDGHIDYRVFASRTPAEVPAQPAFLDLHTTAPAESAWFVVALVVGKDAATAEAGAAALQPIANAEWTGLRIPAVEGDRLVLFRPRDDTVPAAFEDWRTDARAWTVMPVPGGGWRVGVSHARELQRGGQVLLAADRPLSAAAHFEPGRVLLWIEAPEPLTLHVHAAVPPRALVGSVEIPADRLAYDSARHLAALPVAAGASEVILILDSR